MVLLSPKTGNVSITRSGLSLSLLSISPSIPLFRHSARFNTTHMSISSARFNTTSMSSSSARFNTTARLNTTAQLNATQLERTIQHNQHVQLERTIQHNCTSQHNCPAQRNTTQRSAAQLNQLNISAAQHQHSSAVLSSLHLQRLSSHLHLSQKELRRTLARERCRAGAVRMRLQHRSRQPDQPLHLYPRPPPLSTNPLPFSCPPPPLVPPARAVAASIVATATPVAIARATTGRRPVQR